VVHFIGINCQAATDNQNVNKNLHVSLFEKYLGIGLSVITEWCLTALKSLANKSDETWAIKGRSELSLINNFFFFN